MMNIFKVEEIEFKITLIAILIIFSIPVFSSLYSLVTNPEHSISNFVTIAIFLSICRGLFFLKKYALPFAQIIIFFGVFAAIVGVINPFVAGDMMAQGIEPPPAWKLLLSVSPYVAVCLWFLHILGKYKSKFC